MENAKVKSIRYGCILAYSILAAVVLIALGINQKITRLVESTSGVAYEQRVDSVAFGYQLEQPFTPQYERLDKIRLYVDASSCSRDTGELQVSILDENQDSVFFSGLAVSELPEYGWVELPTDIRLSDSKTYTIVLESVGCIDFGPKISFFDAKLAATAEQAGYNLTYAGMEVASSALRIAFIYAVPVEIYQYPVYYVFGLLVMLLLFYSAPAPYSDAKTFAPEQ